MSQAPTTTAPPPRSLLVTLLGLLTLLWGLAILAFSVYAIVRFDDWLNRLGTFCNFPSDPIARRQAMDAINSLPGLQTLLFGVLAFLGLIGFVGGIGVTFRIGRALAIFFTQVNAAAGGLMLYEGLLNNYPAQGLVVPIVMFVYGVITLLVLIFSGREFARERGVSTPR